MSCIKFVQLSNFVSEAFHHCSFVTLIVFLHILVLLNSINGVIDSLDGILVETILRHVSKLVLYFTIEPFEVLTTVVDGLIIQIMRYWQVILPLHSSNELPNCLVSMPAIRSYIRCIDVTIGHRFTRHLVALIQTLTLHMRYLFPLPRHNIIQRIFENKTLVLVISCGVHDCVALTQVGFDVYGGVRFAEQG